jgi:hypothetical protein
MRGWPQLRESLHVVLVGHSKDAIHAQHLLLVPRVIAHAAGRRYHAKPRQAIGGKRANRRFTPAHPKAAPRQLTCLQRAADDRRFARSLWVPIHLAARSGVAGRETHMTKPISTEEQFCSRCNTWGPADMMQPLYRVADAKAAPWLWLHHHCAETCSNAQFEAAMKRFETQVHSAAEAQAGGAIGDGTNVRARLALAAAADRAARSLRDLRQAKAALEKAGMGAEEVPRA